MAPEIQTLAALAVVALTVLWLVRRAVRKDPAAGCGGGPCGAVGPEIRKLRRRLRR